MEKLRTSNQKVIYVPAAISPRQQAQFIQATLILVGIILGNSFSQWFYMRSEEHTSELQSRG